MFSQDGTTARSRTGRPSSAMAPTAARTAAPPPMSDFISSMRSAGLSERPPASKVIALPTSPRTRSPLASDGSYESLIRRGGLWLPWLTAASAPMPAERISSGPRASKLSESKRPAVSSAHSARRAGVHGDSGCGRAQSIGVEVLGRTNPGCRHAVSCKPAFRVGKGRLPELAFELAVLDEVPQLSLQQPVDLLGFRG